MKLNLDKNELNRLDDVFKQFDLNDLCSQIYNNFLQEHYDDITSKDIEELHQKDGMSVDESYFSCFLDALDLDSDDSELDELIKTNKFNNFKLLNCDEYSSNDYLKNIHIRKTSAGKYRLDKNYYAPFEGFTYDQVKTGDNFSEITSIGFFDKRFEFPIIEEDDEVWMSVTPYEINTMREPIEEMRGKVLTFGLGLGYFPYMCSLKPEVESVTIVEKEKNVINKLFDEEILPQFKYRDKIKVIRDDAYAFLKDKGKLNNYDCVFIDIYHNEIDGLFTYLKMKKYEKNSKVKFVYWIEKSILAFLRRIVITLIKECTTGFTDEDYKSYETDLDRAVNEIYHCLKNVEINSFEDIENLLSDDGLRRLVADIKYN